jgi:hypothetical protein
LRDVAKSGKCRDAKRGRGEASVPDVGRWVVGFMVAGIGLFALYLASRAEDATLYYAGIGFFAASVLFNFFQIKQAYDEISHR